MSGREFVDLNRFWWQLVPPRPHLSRAPVVNAYYLDIDTYTGMPGLSDSDSHFLQRYFVECRQALGRRVNNLYDRQLLGWRLHDGSWPPSGHRTRSIYTQRPLDCRAYDSDRMAYLAFQLAVDLDHALILYRDPNDRISDEDDATDPLD